MGAVQSRTSRRRGAGAAIMSLLALAGCSPAPTSSPTISSPSGSHPATAAMPTLVYADQQLAEIATSVVQSRSIQGMVRDPQSLRGNMALRGTTVSSATAPAECTPFRLHEDTESQLRYLDTSANIAAGQMPVTSPATQTVTIAFVIRSAPRDSLVKSDFDYTDSVLSRCSRFERRYTISQAAQSLPGTTYTAELVPAPAVGEKSYATTQKAKGLGAQDMGTGGMQVLAGTIAIDMSATLWPVTPDTTARAMDAMAGFARDILAQALNSAAPQTAPHGARPPEQLAALFANLTGPSGRTFFLNATDSRTVTRMDGASPAPTPGRCTFDDASYYGALAGHATMAHGVGSNEDKMIMFEVTVVSTGTSISQPQPFDMRAAAVVRCSTIHANIQGHDPSTWPSVTPASAKLDADASYAFTYSLPGGTPHWYLRLGARRGNLTVEVNTFADRALSGTDVQPAIDLATAITDQTFAKAGR